MTGSSRAAFLYRLGLVVPSLAAVAAFLVVALARAAYPFAIEWLEAATFTHVARVLEGKPIYAAPSYDFTALIYTPLFYYLAAPVAWLTQNVMLSMRLVSIAAALAAFAALYSLCRARHLPRFLSLLAVGFLAASYKITGYWFDLGRVDTLFLALILLALLLIAARTEHALLLGMAAGIAWILAVAAKQQAVVAFPFLVLYPLAERNWRKATAFALSATLGLLLFAGTFNSASGGWFWFYVFTVPGAEPVSAAWLADTWRLFLAPACWPVVVLTALGVVVALAGRRRRQHTPRLLSLALLVLPLFAMSVLSLAKQWGYVNGFLPAAAGLALAGAEATFYIVDNSPRQRWVRAGLLGTTLLLAWLQFGVSRYDPRDQIPTSTMTAAGLEALDQIRQAPTPIFAPTMPYLLPMTGQPMHLHSQSLSDITLAAKASPEIEEILTQYQGRVTVPYRNGRAATAVLPEVTWYDDLFSAQNGYTCEAFDGPALATLTGAPHALGKLCIRR
jgi:4-amino-4-deoxy-L-arabinose transferase-like glycosyltransferase